MAATLFPVQEILARTCEAPSITGGSRRVRRNQRGNGKAREGAKDATQTSLNTRTELATIKTELVCSQQQLGRTRQKLSDTKQELASTKQKLVDTTQELTAKKLQVPRASMEVEDTVMVTVAGSDQDLTSTEWELVAPHMTVLTSGSALAEGPKEDARSVKDTWRWTWPQLRDHAQHVPSDPGNPGPAPLSNEELPENWTEVCAADAEGDSTKEEVPEAVSSACEDKVRANPWMPTWPTREEVRVPAQCSMAQPHEDSLMYMSLYL